MGVPDHVNCLLRILYMGQEATVRTRYGTTDWFTIEKRVCQGYILSPCLWFLWREWCWSWNSSTLATSCEELTHWKRPWCWEGLGAGGEGDDREWDVWIATPTQWAWVWVNSGSWWWTGKPGVLWFMGSKRVGHDWAELKDNLLYLNLRSKYTQKIFKSEILYISVCLPPLWRMY